MFHKLQSFERNGYHDSYFFDVCYDDANDDIVSVEVGSTAYAGGTSNRPATANAVLAARKVLARKIHAQLRAAEHNKVFVSNDVRPGQRVRLLVELRNQRKESVACDRCEGSGKWVNPRNRHDVRGCFTCSSSGQKPGKAAVKDAKGKIVYDVYPADTSGVVIDCKAYGQFYRNGYNQPGRENRTVKFRTDDGRMVKAPLAKLRLDREPMDDAELLERAERLSYGLRFCALDARCAWESTDEAHEAIAEVCRALKVLFDR